MACGFQERGGGSEIRFFPQMQTQSTTFPGKGTSILSVLGKPGYVLGVLDCVGCAGRSGGACAGLEVYSIRHSDMNTIGLAACRKLVWLTAASRSQPYLLFA